MVLIRLTNVRNRFIAVTAALSFFLESGCHKIAVIEVPDVICAEESDGRFSVCQYDNSKRAFVRWNGVRLTREQLPRMWGPAGPIPSIVHIYEKPRMLNWLRRDLLPYNHFVGSIPYQTVDHDPELLYGINIRTRNLELGFRLVTDFYLIKEVKDPLLKRNTVVEHWRSDFYRKTIAVPAHRVKEVEKLLSELVEANAVSPPVGSTHNNNK